MKHLAYRKIGKGLPIVLIHGYLGDPLMWQLQIEELKKHYEVITPCLAGYAESASLKSPDSINENATLVIELLNHLRIDNYFLLGHSMGGMIVQEMAALYPERINKLICFGTGSIGVLPNRFETINESRTKIKKFGLSKVRQEIAKTWFIDYLIGEGFKLCIDEGRKASTQAALASLDAWECWDGREQLKHIKCPTLIIWSDKDRSYDWSQQNILKKGIVDSRLEIVENCAHNSHMEKPKLFNTIVKNFLS